MKSSFWQFLAIHLHEVGRCRKLQQLVASSGHEQAHIRPAACCFIVWHDSLSYMVVGWVEALLLQEWLMTTSLLHFYHEQKRGTAVYCIPSVCIVVPGL